MTVALGGPFPGIALKQETTADQSATLKLSASALTDPAATTSVPEIEIKSAEPWLKVQVVVPLLEDATIEAAE
jgi:hypothetical protein